MCFLISLSAENCDVDLRARFKARGLELSESRNPHVRSAFGASRRIFEVTHGGCSCDICIWKAKSFDEASERHKLVRKGWSAAKIERAVQSKRASQQRGLNEAHPLRTAFAQAIDELLLAGARVRLLVHFYSGSFSEEIVPVTGHATIRSADLQSSSTDFPVNVLLQVGVS